MNFSVTAIFWKVKRSKHSFVTDRVTVNKSKIKPTESVHGFLIRLVVFGLFYLVFSLFEGW